MATSIGGASKEKKGKKPHKNKPTSKKYLMYSMEGEIAKRKNKFCPRCGAGVFLSSHKDRVYCGKCHYTEFVAKN